MNPRENILRRIRENLASSAGTASAPEMPPVLCEKDFRFRILKTDQSVRISRQRTKRHGYPDYGKGDHTRGQSQKVHKKIPTQFVVEVEPSHTEKPQIHRIRSGA